MHQGLEKTPSGGKRTGATMTLQRGRSSQVAVNLPELLIRVDNDHDLLCELIGIFKEEFPHILQSLRQFVVRSASAPGLIAMCFQGAIGEWNNNLRDAPPGAVITAGRGTELRCSWRIS
jgi:hypothetical protein